MLLETFIHVPGIGPETELSLWQQGCGCWADFLAEPERFTCGSVDRIQLLNALKLAQAAVERKNHRHFQRTLGLKNSWRAFPEFRDACVYLDIETDGRSSGDSVTMVGLYDGAEFRCLVKGDNLTDFPDIIRDYSMIVTFFGAGFDLPMLQKRFPGITMDHLHLDLCITLKKLGIGGGLKKIERRLGLARSTETDGLDGRDAIRLWHRYAHLADASALDTLIAYNREDVVNLETLAEYAYKNLWAQTRTPVPQPETP